MIDDVPMKRRTFLRTLAAAGALPLLAACAAPPTPVPTAVPTPASAATTITMRDSDDQLRALLDTFESQNPTIRVAFTQQG